MIRRLILISAATALLAACGASTPERPASKLTPEEAVAQRAKERWDLLIAKEYGKAYEYLTPGSRAVTTKEAYIRKLLVVRLKWQSARVVRVTCEEPDHCDAVVSVNSLVRLPQLQDEMLVPSPSHEQWIRSAGGWFIVQN